MRGDASGREGMREAGALVKFEEEERETFRSDASGFIYKTEEKVGLTKLSETEITKNVQHSLRK